MIHHEIPDPDDSRDLQGYINVVKHPKLSKIKK